MAQVILSLGSNVGNGEAAIREAVDRLQELVSGLRASSLYRSQPMYVVEQPPFLNAVAIGETHLGPLPFLHRTKAIERELGRKVRYRWGPREIDIDLVAYGSVRYQFADASGSVLEIPHPRFHERRFVLLPLAEICADCIIPGNGPVHQLLSQTDEYAADVVKVSDELLSIRGAG